MQISEETIEKILDLLYDSDEAKANAIMEQMGKNQPVILSYIMQMSEELEKTEERETLLFLAVLVWKSFHETFGDLPEVGEEALKKAEDDLFLKMEMLEKTKDADAVVADEKQPVLMGFIAGEVFADKAESLSPEEHKSVAVHLTSLQVITDTLQSVAF